MAFGHTRPLMDPDLPNAQMLNKRVDIVVLSNAREDARKLFTRSSRTSRGCEEPPMATMTLNAPAPPEAPEEEKKGGKKKLLLVLVLVLALGGAGYWFFLKPSGGPKEPEPGAVVKLDAIQVNLADSHYLRIGIALQASKDAGEELDGSKALDATIELFSGRSQDELARGAYRDKLKEKLAHTLEETYDGEVIGVYFTDFVTQ